MHHFFKKAPNVEPGEAKEEKREPLENLMDRLRQLLTKSAPEKEVLGLMTKILEQEGGGSAALRKPIDPAHPHKTLLMKAVKRGYYDVAKKLIEEFGVDVNEVVYVKSRLSGQVSIATALTIAAKESNLKIARLLLQHRASPGLHYYTDNKKKRTYYNAPLLEAVRKLDVAEVEKWFKISESHKGREDVELNTVQWRAISELRILISEKTKLDDNIKIQKVLCFLLGTNNFIERIDNSVAKDLLRVFRANALASLDKKQVAEAQFYGGLLARKIEMREPEAFEKGLLLDSMDTALEYFRAAADNGYGDAAHAEWLHTLVQRNLNEPIDISREENKIVTHTFYTGQNIFKNGDHYEPSVAERVLKACEYLGNNPDDPKENKNKFTFILDNLKRALGNIEDPRLKEGMEQLFVLIEDQFWEEDLAEAAEEQEEVGIQPGEPRPNNEMKNHEIQREGNQEYKIQPRNHDHEKKNDDNPANKPAPKLGK